MEDTATKKSGLVQASLAWQPGGKPLELHDAVQSYITEDNKNLRAVQMLERIIARHRRALASGNGSIQGQGEAP